MKLPAEFLVQLGRVAAAFGMIETTVQLWAQRAMGANTTVATLVVEKLRPSHGELLDLASSLTLARFKDAKLREIVPVVVARVKKDAENRNTLLHSGWGQAFIYDSKPVQGKLGRFNSKTKRGAPQQGPHDLADADSIKEVADHMEETLRLLGEVAWRIQDESVSRWGPFTNLN